MRSTLRALLVLTTPIDEDDGENTGVTAEVGDCEGWDVRLSVDCEIQDVRLGELNMMAAFVTALPVTAQWCSVSKLSSRAPNGVGQSRSRNARVARVTRVTMSGPGPESVAVVTTPLQQTAPPTAFEAAGELGAAKAGMPTLKLLVLGFLAGCYIALGGLLALSVGGSVPGLAAGGLTGLQRLLFGLVGLPTGLMLVLIAGGELFTGNTMLMTAALLQGKVGAVALLRNWVLSYAANFVGSLFVVWLACSAGVLSGLVGSAAAATAVAKTSMGFGVAFYKGVLCNWLVSLAVYMATGAGDMGGKCIAVFLPISAFVAMGFEHSVANMFLIPAGMKAGAAVGWRALLLGNLLPVTLGNIVAGVVLIAGAYYVAFGKK